MKNAWQLMKMYDAQANYYDEYEAYEWKYTEKGYLFLEEYHPPGFDGAPGETGFRVQPLDKTCRELNRKYVMPLGYALNNLLITNWDNQNYTELDFYDLYEKMYYMKYGKQVPYEARLLLVLLSGREEKTL